MATRTLTVSHPQNEHPVAKGTVFGGPVRRPFMQCQMGLKDFFLILGFPSTLITELYLNEFD